MSLLRNPLAPSPLQVWAVEDTAVQITWGDLPAGEVSAWVGDTHTARRHEGGPGWLELTGLLPGTAHRIDVSWAGGRDQLEARTLASPPGELLTRVATVSDLHLGARRWGAAKTMVDRSDHSEPHTVRCARAAITEAAAWGADLLVVKGDVAHLQDAAHFEMVGDLLDSFPDLPIVLLPGNHDVDGRGDGPTPAKVGERGIPYVRDTTCLDLPGIRVIGGDTTVPGQGAGSIDAVADDLVELATLSPGPFLLAIHHQLHRYRIPTHYPVGISHPSSVAFLDSLGRANPNGLVTSGHTHRNRSRRHGRLRVTEVASTRDWPGVWAGYAVHEGGIRQVVRRTVADDAIGWHEYSRRALFGLWEPWAAGPLQQRCFVHNWV